MSRSLFADWEPREKLPPAPRLVLAFGSSTKPLSQLTCDDVHHRPIRRGSRICCAVCHQSGCDHLDLPGKISLATGGGRTEQQIRAAAKAQRLRHAN